MKRGELVQFDAVVVPQEGTQSSRRHELEVIVQDCSVRPDEVTTIGGLIQHWGWQGFGLVLHVMLHLYAPTVESMIRK